ncbi:Retrovirus-related Pol polyprotein from transposon 17.6 [Labeo rohita]|uniref:ribonuclease H n=1 Tax=Labeo rohita TaxID=84645 RepID=A0ABQ8M651_LABRO|nr:Retrovirus-related Pol polyprotein from transposon 17.6 [Labeo rohita]
MYQDVQEYVKTCAECQMVAPVRKSDRSYLQPLPIIGIPFDRIGMDIIGPLVKSSSGHQFALVICDYATRYPEVYPLRSIQVKHIVRCLIDLISRVGVPSEIITDQGTNFMAKLMKLLYKQLGIRGIRTTPFHPQTDGLVERFNGTLKNMLKKFVDESGRDWDKWLPFLLFAYGAVPQCSTGFSPFELLFGRQVRGPLNMLKEEWTAEKPAQCSIASYILQIRDKLKNFRTLTKDNLLAAQQRQKVWYDTHARETDLKPGQKVLVLLPSGTSKLLTKWQGPYIVTRKLSPVTYEILCPERKQPKQVLHVNLLKEFKERTTELKDLKGLKDQVMMVKAVVEEEDETEMEPVRPPKEDAGDFHHLNNQQQQQLTEVVQSYPSLFQERPSRTKILIHNIILKDSTPIHQKPYRVPERMVEQLKTEIETMLEMGIIEPSTSEWSSPILLVPKKDGGIGFCTDFRKLNSVSCFDSYPMPRIDELIERLGKASYITTLDLCKGYWQVPLDPSCKSYTAFRSPTGLYQYTVLPFGLHGAPATFQRLMDQVLAGCEQYAAAYLDDAVIYSGTWQEHLRHLDDILKRLQEAGLTINTTKCSWAQEEVKYLGYLLGHGQIRPQVEKLKAIRNIAQPQTKRQEPVLQSPNFSKRFIVQVDASDVGLGAVLVQGKGDEERPVLFLSRKLFERERKYSTIEKEGLAIKWAVDSLRYYLLGREFTLRTDHRALKWMQTMQNSNSRILRWCLTLQPYVFTIALSSIENCLVGGATNWKPIKSWPNSSAKYKLKHSGFNYPHISEGKPVISQWEAELCTQAEPRVRASIKCL